MILNTRRFSVSLCSSFAKQLQMHFPGFEFFKEEGQPEICLMVVEPAPDLMVRAGMEIYLRGLIDGAAMPHRVGDLSVLAAQRAYTEAGYQWVEHIFNDDNPANCTIDFTKIADPLYFCRHPVGEFGWGRFPREIAWSMALDWLKSNNPESSPCHEKL